MMSKLDLDNIRTLHFRAEDFSHEIDFRESFDVCVSRAVANLSVLYEYCLPTLKIGGSFISYKSLDVDDELHQAKNSLQILGGDVQAVEKFDLSDEISRSFVITKKIAYSPLKYPRKAGTPSKTPL